MIANRRIRQLRECFRSINLQAANAFGMLDPDASSLTEGQFDELGMLIVDIADDLENAQSALTSLEPEAVDDPATRDEEDR